MVESRSPKPLVLGSSPSAPAKESESNRFRIFYFGGARTRTRFPVGNGFSDGKNGANRLVLGVKPRTMLKAVFGRVFRNAPPGCFGLAYLAPLPKVRYFGNGLFIFVCFAGARTRTRFPMGNGFSDDKNGANRLVLGVKPRTMLKAVFGRVFRNAPPGRQTMGHEISPPGNLFSGNRECRELQH